MAVGSVSGRGMATPETGLMTTAEAFSYQLQVLASEAGLTVDQIAPFTAAASKIQQLGQNPEAATPEAFKAVLDTLGNVYSGSGGAGKALDTAVKNFDQILTNVPGEGEAGVLRDFSTFYSRYSKGFSNSLSPFDPQTASAQEALQEALNVSKQTTPGWEDIINSVAGGDEPPEETVEGGWEISKALAELAGRVVGGSSPPTST